MHDLSRTTIIALLAASLACSTVDYDEPETTGAKPSSTTEDEGTETSGSTSESTDDGDASTTDDGNSGLDTWYQDVPDGGWTMTDSDETAGNGNEEYSPEAGGDTTETTTVF